VTTMLTERTRALLVEAQGNELTEHLVYHRLATQCKDPENATVLERIAEEELAHNGFWARYTGAEAQPNRARAGRYALVARVFGLTFALKLMERNERSAQVLYEAVAREIPEAGEILQDEDEHEHALLNMLDEERLHYVGSMVLGLSDALVELTGALAGFTLALRDTQLIATTGLITGLSASLSMAASEFLSTQSSADEQADPRRAATYTGVTYVATVVLLILPFLLISNYLVALAVTLVVAMLVVLAFTYYVSVAQDLAFRRRFLQMAGIILGVALVSFGIGYLVRVFFGIEI